MQTAVSRNLEAARLISQIAPVEVERYYQYNVELATILVELAAAFLAGVSGNLFAALILDSVQHLYSKRQPRPLGGASRVQIHITRPDGTRQQAIVDSDDPEVVRAAIESLTAVPEQPADLVRWDAEQDLWLPPGTPRG